MPRSAFFRSPGLSGPCLTGIAGDLGGDFEQVEVLPPHLQEDLALSVELEGFFERFLDLVLMLRLVVVVVIVVMRGCPCSASKSSLLIGGRSPG